MLRITTLPGFHRFISPSRRYSLRYAQLLIQYSIELRPNLVLLCAGKMTEGALVSRFHFGTRSLRFVVIEIEVPPLSRGRKVLRIFDSHIGTVEGAGEISS